MIIPNRNIKPTKLSLKWEWEIENYENINTVGIIISSISTLWSTAILKPDWTIIDLSDKITPGFDKSIVNSKGNIWFLYSDSTLNLFLNRDLELYIPDRIDEHLSSDYLSNLTFPEWILIFEREDRIGIMDEDFNLRIIPNVDYGGVWTDWYITVRDKKTQEYYVIDKNGNIIYDKDCFKWLDIGLNENWYFHFMEDNHTQNWVGILRRYQEEHNWTTNNKIQYIGPRFDNVWYIWPCQVFWWREKGDADSKIFKIVDVENRKSLKIIFVWYMLFWNYDDTKYQDQYIFITQQDNGWFNKRDLKKVYLVDTKTEKFLFNVWDILENLRIDLNKTPIEKVLITIVNSEPIVSIALMNWTGYLIDPKWNLINKFGANDFDNKNNLFSKEKSETHLILKNWIWIGVNSNKYSSNSIKSILDIKETIETVEYVWDKMKIRWKLFNKKLVNKKFGQ